MTEILNFDTNGEWIENFRYVLRHHDLGLNAAEFHGTLTGLICTDHSNRSVNHCQELLVSKSEAQPLLDAICGLITLTERSLESPDFNFQPNFCSATGLPERTEALGDRCRGFTPGISWNDTTTVTSFDEETAKALSDIAQFALSDSGTNIPATEERAFVKLEEYLRVNAQLIYEESCSSRLPSSAMN